MPLEGTHRELGKAIVDKVLSSSTSQSVKDQMVNQWATIMEVVLKHIVRNAEVVVEGAILTAVTGNLVENPEIKIEGEGQGRIESSARLL